MTQQSQNRRRRIVINAKAQGRMVMSFMLLPAIALAFVAVLTGIWCAHIQSEAVAAGLEMPDLMPFFWALIAFEVGAAVFLVGASLRTTLRVSGPAYNICRSLERIRNGDLDFKVKLRDHDFLTEIETELNKTLDWLNQNPPAGCKARAVTAATHAAAETPEMVGACAATPRH